MSEQTVKRERKPLTDKQKRDRVRASLAWNRRNPEVHRACNRRYYEKNKEKILAKRKEQRRLAKIEKQRQKELEKQNSKSNSNNV